MVEKPSSSQQLSLTTSKATNKNNMPFPDVPTTHRTNRKRRGQQLTKGEVNFKAAQAQGNFI